MSQLHVDVTPTEAFFLVPCDHRAQSTHLLRNTTRIHVAVKIKCTDNRNFRIHPVYFIIPPKESRQMVITRQPISTSKTENKKEKVVIEYTEDAGGENLRDLFRSHASKKKEIIELILTDKLLRLNPPQATFFSPYDRISRSLHTLINCSPNQRVAFKVKCSTRDQYKIRPVTGILESQSSHQLYITRLEGPQREKGRQKLRIVFTEVPDRQEDAKAIFQTTAQEAVNAIEVPLIDANKPELEVSPPRLAFPPTRTAQQTKTTTASNLTTFYRLAIKVRCSDNKQFRVSPVFAVVEPMGRCEFTVTRVAAPFDGVHTHQLHFLYAELPPNTDDPDLQAFFHTLENARTVKLEMAVEQRTYSIDMTQASRPTSTSDR